MRVEEIMTEEPVYVDANAPIIEALNLFNEMDIRHLPVMDGGELVGMLSDTDLQNYDLPIKWDPDEANARLRKTPVSLVMSPDPMSVGPEDDVIDVVRIMIDYKYASIPVIDPIEGEIVGIVSYIDILRLTEELLEE